MPFEIMICKYSPCSREFLPKREGQKFCCGDCRREWFKENYRKKEEPQPVDPNEKFKPVFDFIKKHYEETGEYLQYGDAVLLMEKVQHGL